MRITALSGGVGGARMLRGLAALPGLELTAVVNVADDESTYGLHLAPDLDTVIYTLANVESNERGWGRTAETWNTMAELEAFPIDTTLRMGDKDLALNLFRTARLAGGATLAEVTADIARVFGIRARVLPVTNDPVQTKVQILPSGRWLDFQEYFVTRRHSDPVGAVRFDGARAAAPTPGVIEAIGECDAVVIGPSNPFLSIWPILAVPGVAAAISEKKRIMGVSPLIGGDAVKGPLVDVMDSLGYEVSTAGIVQAYDGLLTDVVVHQEDDAPAEAGGVRIRTASTLIQDETAAKILARSMLEWLS